MYILSVDTTAKTATACVAKDDSTIGLIPVSTIGLNSTLTHSESLLPMIDNCLRMAKISLSDIDYIALTNGPGSFTGVRIGAAAVKGLSFSMGGSIPCIPLSTLLCLARNLEGMEEETVVCPLMDARREQFYNAMFTIKSGIPKRLTDDRVITASELTEELCANYGGKKIMICGDGALLFYGLYQKYEGQKPVITLPPAKDLLQNAFSVALCAYDVITDEGFDKSEYQEKDLLPSYLRLSQAERERNEKLAATSEEK